MNRSDFDQRWAKFRSKVVDNAASPEQLNDMKMAYIGGMVELYHYVTAEVSELPEWQAMQAISAAGVTLQNVSTEVVKEGFTLLEGMHGEG